jgi:hypothetical protein
MLRKGQHRRTWASEWDASNVLNAFKTGVKFEIWGDFRLYAADGAVIVADASKIEGSRQVNGEIKGRGTVVPENCEVKGMGKALPSKFTMEESSNSSQRRFRPRQSSESWSKTKGFSRG